LRVRKERRRLVSKEFNVAVQERVAVVGHDFGGRLP